MSAAENSGKREGNSARISDASASASDLLLGCPSRRESDKSTARPLCRAPQFGVSKPISVYRERKRKDAAFKRTNRGQSVADLVASVEFKQ